MAQWLKALAANLTFILGTHMVEERTDFHKLSCVLDMNSVVEITSITPWGSTHTPLPPSASLATAVKNRFVIQPYPWVTHPLTPAFKEMHKPHLQKCRPKLENQSEGQRAWSGWSH